MAWCPPGDKPLSESMMVSLVTYICVTRPQWVKPIEAKWHIYAWVQIMACHQAFSELISLNKVQWNSNQTLQIFVEENWFENLVCSIGAILSQCQCVNRRNSVHAHWSKSCKTGEIYFYMSSTLVLIPMLFPVANICNREQHWDEHW